MNFFKRLFGSSKEEESSQEFTKYVSENYQKTQDSEIENEEDNSSSKNEESFENEDGYYVYKRCVKLATAYYTLKGYEVDEVDKDYTSYPQIQLYKDGEKNTFVYIEFTWKNQTFEDLFDQKYIEVCKKEDLDLNNRTWLMKFSFVDDQEELFYEDKHYEYTIEERIVT